MYNQQKKFFNTDFIFHGQNNYKWACRPMPSFRNDLLTDLTKHLQRERKKYQILVCTQSHWVPSLRNGLHSCYSVLYTGNKYKIFQCARRRNFSKMTGVRKEQVRETVCKSLLFLQKIEFLAKTERIWWFFSKMFAKMQIFE